MIALAQQCTTFASWANINVCVYAESVVYMIERINHFIFMNMFVLERTDHVANKHTHNWINTFHTFILIFTHRASIAYACIYCFIVAVVIVGYCVLRREFIIIMNEREPFLCYACSSVVYFSFFISFLKEWTNNTAPTTEYNILNALNTKPKDEKNFNKCM